MSAAKDARDENSLEAWRKIIETMREQVNGPAEREPESGRPCQMDELAERRQAAAEQLAAAEQRLSEAAPDDVLFVAGEVVEAEREFADVDKIHLYARCALGVQTSDELEAAVLRFSIDA